MQWGTQLEMLAEMQETTGITPLALQSRPVIDDRLFYFYALFGELTRDREYDAAGGPMSLKRRSLMEYGVMEDWTLAEIQWAWPLIAMFDDVWLEIAREKHNDKMSTKMQTVGG